MRQYRSRGRGARWTRWIVLSTVVLVGVSFVVSTLVLRVVVEKQLRKKTRLHWTVSGATWSPWGGVRLSGLRAEVEPRSGMEIPPVLEVAHIQVDPYWRTLWGKNLRLREVVITSPKGKVPLQLLSLLGTSGEEVVVPRTALPELAREEDPKPRSQKAPRKKKPGTARKKRKAKSDQKPKPEKKPEAESDQEQKSKPGLPCRVRVTGGELELYSLNEEEEGVRLSGVAMDLPVAGSASEGSFRLAEVSVRGIRWAGPMEQKCRWEEPFLIIPETVGRWQGVEAHFGGRLQLRGPLRFALAMQAKPGNAEALVLPEWTGLQVQVEQIRTGLLRCEGDLRRPASWRVELLADVRGVEFSQEQRRQNHRFDLGQVVAVFQNGVLQVPDVRLRSEAFLIMGNAIVLSNGRLWSVARVVADPEISRVLSRIVIGSGLSRGWMSSWLQPLGTPDRRYRDVHIEGTVFRAMADVGKRREEIELREALKVLQAFFGGEMREDEWMRAVRKEGASS